MKVSEFIERMKDLMEVCGDVDVVIETKFPNQPDDWRTFVLAGVESQNASRAGKDAYVTHPENNNDLVIKVY